MKSSRRAPIGDCKIHCVSAETFISYFVSPYLDHLNKDGNSSSLSDFMRNVFHSKNNRLSIFIIGKNFEKYVPIIFNQLNTRNIGVFA